MASNLIATEIVAVSCDPVIVHLWDVLSGASEVDSSSAYYELTSRLSPICVTHLWEGASSLVSAIRGSNISYVTYIKYFIAVNIYM